MKQPTYCDYKSTAAWKNHVSRMHKFVYLISDRFTGVVTGVCMMLAMRSDGHESVLSELIMLI